MLKVQNIFVIIFIYFKTIHTYRDYYDNNNYFDNNDDYDSQYTSRQQHSSHNYGNNRYLVVSNDYNSRTYWPSAAPVDNHHRQQQQYYQTPYTRPRKLVDNYDNSAHNNDEVVVAKVGYKPMLQLPSDIHTFVKTIGTTVDTQLSARNSRQPAKTLWITSNAGSTDDTVVVDTPHNDLQNQTILSKITARSSIFDVIFGGYDPEVITRQPPPPSADDIISQPIQSVDDVYGSGGKGGGGVNGNGDGLGRQLYDPSCGYTHVQHPRIVGGREAPDGQYPWLVAVLRDGDAWCGGTIVNQWWVILASHCFYYRGLTPDHYTWAVRVGTNDRNRGTTYKVHKIVTHARYNKDSMMNSDIAMIKTTRPIKFNKLVKPVCLPNHTYAEPRSLKMIAAGWGAEEFDNPNQPIRLRDVSLTLTTDKDCARMYQLKKQTIYRSQLCTWSYGKDACQGDSGGPLVELYGGRYFMVGVVSFGATCADKFPGVFTQVSYYLQWIIDTIKKN